MRAEFQPQTPPPAGESDPKRAILDVWGADEGDNETYLALDEHCGENLSPELAEKLQKEIERLTRRLQVVQALLPDTYEKICQSAIFTQKRNSGRVKLSAGALQENNLIEFAFRQGHMVHLSQIFFRGRFDLLTLADYKSRLEQTTNKSQTSSSQGC